jgi:hypothetical protein
MRRSNGHDEDIVAPIGGNGFQGARDITRISGDALNSVLLHERRGPVAGQSVSPGKKAKNERAHNLPAREKYGSGFVKNRGK